MSIDKLEDVIKDIEQGQFTSTEIITKYGISTYKYYKILKEYDIKNTKTMKKGPKAPFGRPIPKNTAFKMLLNGEANPINESFNFEQFKKDYDKGEKITNLMEKYHLTLYQVRELRKKCNEKCNEF